MNSKTFGNKKSTFGLILFLLFFIIIWLSEQVFLSVKYTGGVLFFSVAFMSVFLIVKYKSVKKWDIIAAVLLGGIACASNPFFGAVAIFAFLGGQSVFRGSGNKIKLIKSKSGENGKDIAAAVLTIIIAGAVLGAVNVLCITVTGAKANPGFELKFLLLAFRAGVAEEIIFRFLLFAICVHITKDKALSKVENALCYVIMSFPHALYHISLYNFNAIMLLGLFILFGLPFALLQRKRDLTTAMGSHFLVDLIRFCVFRA